MNAQEMERSLGFVSPVNRATPIGVVRSVKTSAGLPDATPIVECPACEGFRFKDGHPCRCCDGFGAVAMIEPRKATTSATGKR